MKFRKVEGSKKGIGFRISRLGFYKGSERCWKRSNYLGFLSASHLFSAKFAFGCRIFEVWGFGIQAFGCKPLRAQSFDCCGDQGLGFEGG